jgi:hypothetical protein
MYQIYTYGTDLKATIQVHPFIGRYGKEKQASAQLVIVRNLYLYVL